MGISNFLEGKYCYLTFYNLIEDKKEMLTQRVRINGVSNRFLCYETEKSFFAIPLDNVIKIVYKKKAYELKDFLSELGVI